VVRADAGQVRACINGLLSNAVKFCNPGGRVTLRVERTADGNAHVEVHDTGIGIDSRHLAKVFEGTYQSEQSRPRRFGGLGIGLILIKDIINNLNGKIWVESQPGKGASFHFTLPLYNKL